MFSIFNFRITFENRETIKRYKLRSKLRSAAYVCYNKLLIAIAIQH